MAAPRQQIIGLDVLRLLAATLVMLYHFGFWHWTRGQTLLPGRFAGPPPGGHALHFGWVGVEIFFVISGFVIAYSADGVDAERFLKSRVLRLVPGVWVCATVTAVLFGLVSPPDISRLLVDYASTVVLWPLRSIDGVYWTLGIEIVFYALVYVLVRRGRIAVLEPAMIAIGLGSGVFWVLALCLAHGLENATGALATLHMLVLRAEANRELQLLLVQHGCFFAVGVVVHRMMRAGVTVRRAGFLLGLVAACLLEIVGQNTIIERASGESLSAGPALAAWGIAMALLVAAIVWNDALLRGLGRHGHAVRFAGRMTYPLYLVHNAVGLSVSVMLAPFLGLSGVSVALAAAFVCAGLIEAFPERALRRLLAARVFGDRPARKWTSRVSF